MPRWTPGSFRLGAGSFVAIQPELSNGIDAPPPVPEAQRPLANLQSSFTRLQAHFGHDRGQQVMPSPSRPLRPPSTGSITWLVLEPTDSEIVLHTGGRPFDYGEHDVVWRAGIWKQPKPASDPMLSDDECTAAILQGDSNLVLYLQQGGGAIWASSTNGGDSKLFLVRRRSDGWTGADEGSDPSRRFCARRRPPRSGQ